MPNEINLQMLFLNLQKSLITKLEVSRYTIHHPVAKGVATETNWIGMLEEYLPKRYQVSQAFVVDSKGGISEYQDIVIYDRQYSPLILNHAGIIYVPAESVYAVFEIKQSINANHVEYAGGKIRSVRNLYRTNATITHAGGKYDKPRDLFPILGGLLTLESDWTPPLGSAFKAALKSLPDEGRIDLGCSLQNGSFNIIYDAIKGITVEIKDGKITLLSFFLRLLDRLQALGTAPAIDIAAYEKWV